MKKGKISLLLGLLGGTVLGVLFAPHKGKDIRQKIQKEREIGGTGLKTLKDEFKGMGKDVKDFCGDVYQSENVQSGIEYGKEKMLEKTEAAKEELGKITAKHGKHLRRLKKKAKEHFEDAKSALQKLKETGKSLMQEGDENEK